ncbi:MAG TPA: sigma-70 family RNA polymerase sigma factor [Bacteroidota bacterium]|nr:sigma-70 family RNA polymerase sigma factor [Bacteroidota bacterium]
MNSPAIFQISEETLPLESRSDEALITMFQGGDRSIYRVLVDRHKDRVRNVVYSIFRDPDMVDDMAQEVFIKAYEALPNFRFESSFYTWLYRITVNKARDEMRKRKVKRFFSLDLMTEQKEHHPALQTQAPTDMGVADMVTTALDRLPEKFRLPVILKDIEGLSYEEIAETLDCEVGTVKSRLSRARAMLRSILTPLMEAE